MPDEQENIQVHDPTSQEKHKDYERSDVAHLMAVRQWHNWEELHDWLRRESDNDNELTPGEVRHLIDDVDRARQRGATFTSDTDAVWEALRAGR